MFIRRRHNSLALVARIIVAALLFGQVSVAAHACKFGEQPAAMQPCADHEGSLVTESFDAFSESFDAFCKAHCEAYDQTIDQAKLPAADVSKVFLVVRMSDVQAPRAPRERDIDPAAASPPLPILLCSLRN
jgi:hypothetical protein